MHDATIKHVYFYEHLTSIIERSVTGHNKYLKANLAQRKQIKTFCQPHAAPLVPQSREYNVYQPFFNNQTYQMCFKPKPERPIRLMKERNCRFSLKLLTSEVIEVNCFEFQ